jgi:hypothetical protein
MSDSNQTATQPLELPRQISRRDALQWVMAFAAASALPEAGFANRIGPTTVPSSFKGYGADPNLMQIHKPGSLWPLTFTKEQRQAAKTLANVIIPKDALGPAASEVGVVEMLDEWISAPYPAQQADRPAIVDGLIWLDAESKTRFGKSFASLTTEQHHAICDDICYSKTAKPEFHKAAGFFARFRTLAASAYYATPEGWQAIGYVGNVPLQRFDGPPKEVLERLGMEQTVV